jgi:hypothetical protein
MAISKYTAEGKFICTYPDKNTCADDNKITNPELSNTLKNRSAHVKGYRYKITGFRPQKDLKPITINLKNRKVMTINFDGAYTFDSIKECAEFYEVDPSTISKMLSGKRKNKYNLRYVN